MLPYHLLPAYYYYAIRHSNNKPVIAVEVKSEGQMSPKYNHFYGHHSTDISAELRQFLIRRFISYCAESTDTRTDADKNNALLCCNY